MRTVGVSPVFQEEWSGPCDRKDFRDTHGVYSSPYYGHSARELGPPLTVGPLPSRLRHEPFVSGPPVQVVLPTSAQPGDSCTTQVSFGVPTTGLGPGLDGVTPTGKVMLETVRRHW